MKAKMNVFINGISTRNKGAELMLYAMLHELEIRFPDANVIIPIENIPEGAGYIKSELRITLFKKAFLIRLLKSIKVFSILRRLGFITSIDLKRVPKDIDLFLDASGFTFSDQWKKDPSKVMSFERMCKFLKQNGAKLVFLPQAAGPFTKSIPQKEALAIIKNADLFIAREEDTYKYCKEFGFPDKILRKFTDFTSPVKGVFPAQYEHLKGNIAIIPNLRMIDKGVITLDRYIEILTAIIDLCFQYGKSVFLLNHEGIGDEKLCHILNERLVTEVPVAVNLNALEVKGLISESHLVISSRYHGVASALNCAVPCLATSWSHKYARLFEDYGITDGILEINEMNATLVRVSELLDPIKHDEMKELLLKQKSSISKQTEQMWETVWSIVNM